ncbi:hypothetical protein PF008_g1286 [Phytophthora fragariae]|uniref:Uncharacterized protein n=1 Tax=Phytophthora fragariae TaxID=53985 RepID=A0A6G0SKR3_9STRA|nr:hypothetical protein PF008_g1286 [Phytophthora fragariae]
MDGASYHKRLTNPTPNKKRLKADIQAWLVKHGIKYEEKDVIAQLLKFEDKYAAALDDCCLASEEENSEDGEGDNYGSNVEDDGDVVVYSF